MACVWFPSDPILGAAVAANLAAVPGVPKAVVDADAEWADASSLLLDESPPGAGPADDLLGPAAKGPGDVHVVGCSGIDAATVAALRATGGGVVVMPAQLCVAAAVAECDVVVLGVARSFPSLRRARLALDAMPAAHGDLVPVLVPGPPSDVTHGDVERVLALSVTVDLSEGAKEAAASLERGTLPAALPVGPWSLAIARLATAIWPGAHFPAPRRERLRPGSWSKR